MTKQIFEEYWSFPCEEEHVVEQDHENLHRLPRVQELEGTLHQYLPEEEKSTVKSFLR